MNPTLDPAQAAFRAGFARVCRDEIAPHAAAADRAGALSPDAWRAVVRSGYLALFHPRALGGVDADGITQAIAMELLGQACASTLWAATISSVLCGKILHQLCRPVHHERWLRPIITGDRIGCFAASEQGAGCDPASYATTVRDHGGRLRLTGEKHRISNAGAADVAVVLARVTDPAAPAAPGPLCYVVVDLRQPGVTRADEPRLGLRAMSWGSLAFDGVEVAAADVITDASMDQTLQAVEWGQLLQSLCAIGIAEAALASAATYARERHAFGRPIGHLDVVHARLADAHAEIDAARLLAYEAAWIKAQGRAARELVMMAKIHATEMAVRCCDRAMQTFGGWGYATRHPVERYYRDSLANVPAGLTTDRLRELLACPMVGADPWHYDAFDWLGPAGLALA